MFRPVELAIVSKSKPVHTLYQGNLTTLAQYTS